MKSRVQSLSLSKVQSLSSSKVQSLSLSKVQSLSLFRVQSLFFSALISVWLVQSLLYLAYGLFRFCILNKLLEYKIVLYTLLSSKPNDIRCITKFVPTLSPFKSRRVVPMKLSQPTKFISTNILILIHLYSFIVPSH